jgi:RecA-family ATPase
MKTEPKNATNIDIWNLRGKAVPMDRLAPKIVRRAVKKNYIAIIIDPIYKVLTGDENSAEHMAHFCNQFDKVCNELGCAVIYCHHHSKGGQGDKRSMDRASGSGVFARDPDALLDLIELEITDDLLKQQQNESTRQLCMKQLTRWVKGWEDDISDDDMLSAAKMLKYCDKQLTTAAHQRLLTQIEEENKRIAAFTAWRIEGTLREFPRFPPLNVWFRYPVHVADEDGVLQDLQSENSRKAPYKRNFSKKKTNAERAEDRRQALLTAFSAAVENGTAQIKDIAEYMGVEPKTVTNYIRQNSDIFWCKNGLIGPRKDLNEI